MQATNQKLCEHCNVQREDIFCDLPQLALEDLDRIAEKNRVVRGTTIFQEGHHSKGAFLVCRGRIKLSVCSDSGKRLLLGIAETGEVLGLSAALLGIPYEMTAETIDDAQLIFIKRKDLQQFLRDHKEACLHAVHSLSHDLHCAFDRVRVVGLGRTRRPRTLSAKN